ncbi:MAG: PIG-L family deacetylase [Candidatus Omnitrophica bacterium]|nr:PIG-L family deacetylase [Candidatus Omnitrophota bacterium]
MKKIISILIIMIFLCQNQAFCLIERDSALRPPMRSDPDMAEFIATRSDSEQLRARTLKRTNIHEDKMELSHRAAEYFVKRLVEQLKAGKKVLVVFPTGRTPEYFYDLLPRYIDQLLGREEWERLIGNGTIQFANLDEYVFPVLEGTNEALRHPETLTEFVNNLESIFGPDLGPIVKELSYGYYMQEVYKNLGIPDSAVSFINALHEDPNQAAEDYEETFTRARSEGRKIIRVYGIGPAEEEEGMQDVHLAFLKRGTLFSQKTVHYTKLPPAARAQNREVFDQTVGPDVMEVPTHAISTGYPDEDDIIIVLASGEGKALSLYLIMSNEPTPEIPATYIHRCNDAMLFVDKAAFSKIEDVQVESKQAEASIWWQREIEQGRLPSRIKVAAFDIGGVFYEYDPRRAVDAMTEATNVPAQDCMGFLKDYIDGSPILEFEKGGDIEEFVRAFNNRFREVKGFKALTVPVFENPALWEKESDEYDQKLLAKIQEYQEREDIIVVIVTDTNPLCLKNAHLPHLGPLVHRIFASCEMGVLKRDMELKFWRKVLDELGVEPDEVLVIDDREMNIETASEIGIVTLLHKSTAKTMAVLEEMDRQRQAASDRDAKGIELSVRDIADSPSSIARLGEPLEGTRNVRVPENETILIFETGNGLAASYQRDTISKLRARNKIEIYTIDEGAGYDAIEKTLDAFKPTIIMLPEETTLPDGTVVNDSAFRIRAIVDRWADRQDSPILGFGYALVENLRQHNLWLFYGEGDSEISASAISAHESQNTRVPYGEAAESSARARAATGKILFPARFSGTEEEYAEVFAVQRMTKKGSWGSYEPDRPNHVYTLEELGFSGNMHLFVGSPHMDDTPIPLSVLAMRFGGRVTDFVMTTGHRAFIRGVDDRRFRTRDDFNDTQMQMIRSILQDSGYLPAEWREAVDAIIEKFEGRQDLSEDEERMVRIVLAIKIREGETLNSDRILGIEERNIIFNRFPFYDRTEGGERVLGTDDSNSEIEKTYEALRRAYEANNGNLVVAIPSPEDAHPNHRATYYIFERALQMLAEEYSADIPVILYVSPWFGRGNVYNYASPESQNKLAPHAPEDIKSAIAAQQEAYAIVGGELVCLKFGAAPNYSVLGGNISERINVFWLSSQRKIRGTN